MQRKSFGHMPCPIARSLERVGEWWSILILRDALHGYTRFDQFQRSLGIAPNMLTRRLNALVEAGLMARRRYSEQSQKADKRDPFGTRRKVIGAVLRSALNDRTMRQIVFRQEGFLVETEIPGNRANESTIKNATG